MPPMVQCRNCRFVRDDEDALTMVVCTPRRISLLALTLMHFIVDLYAGFFSPLIPRLVGQVHLFDDLRQTAAWVAMLFGIKEFVCNAIQPVAGVFSPRLQRPLLLVIGPVLSTAVCLMGYTQSFWVLAFLVLLSAAGVGLFHPEGLLGAHEVSGAREHLGVPIFLSSGFLGFSTGAFAAAQWVDWNGFRYFWTLAAPGLAAAGMGICFLVGRYRLALHGPSEAHPADAARPQAYLPPFWAVQVLGFLLAASVSLLFGFFPLHIQNHLPGAPLRLGGQALFVLGLTTAVACNVWGHVSARRSVFRLTALGQVCCLPLTALLLTTRSPAMILVWSTGTGLCAGSAFFPLVATKARRARGLTRSLRAAFIVGGSWGGGALVAAVGGYLLAYVSVQAVLFASLGLMAAAAGVAVWLALREAAAGREPTESAAQS